MKTITPSPRRINFQWHVTDKCNLKCQHCYQDQHLNELSYESLQYMLTQFSALVKSLPRFLGGHITLTGGEPFVRDDFLSLIHEIRAKTNFTFSVLTNGTLLNLEICRALKKLGVCYVQVSIDGDQQRHDQIRGKGNFKKVIKSIKLLKKYKIRTLISFTAMRSNYKVFPKVAALGRKLKVDKIWSDRLIPHGEGRQLKEELMNADECHDFFTIMRREQIKSKLYPLAHTEVSLHRALQFKKTGKTPYRCSAGGELITRGSRGEIWPCRRMPIKVGNILEDNLIDIYNNNKLFQQLRDFSHPIKGCDSCRHKNVCNGGLKCLSYALTGTPFVGDFGCKLTNRKL